MGVDERAAYVALALTPGIGAARLATLLETFGGPLGALAAPIAFLRTLPGITAAGATAIRQTDSAAGEKILSLCDRMDVRCLMPSDPDYPHLLGPIPDPPPLLFARGDLGLLARPAVAIVGSREHSAYGGEVCRLVSDRAARAGLAVVSGMARGLDAVAHLAALEAGGATIGILGNGFGVIYPAANRTLYHRVAAEGLLLTEFPPGERPHAHSFPRRNRLISGLARVTVVVEAAHGSGTMITVDTALAQGRDVMAVPGAITSRTSVGTNRLIRDGATPLLEPEDLLRHFPEVWREPGARPLPAPQLQLPLSEEERRVHAALGAETVHLDSLIAVVGRPVGEVLGVLCGLEIAGAVEQLPGRMFRRVG